MSKNPYAFSKNELDKIREIMFKNVFAPIRESSEYLEYIIESDFVTVRVQIVKSGGEGKYCITVMKAFKFDVLGEGEKWVGKEVEVNWGLHSTLKVFRIPVDALSRQPLKGHMIILKTPYIEAIDVLLKTIDLIINMYEKCCIGGK